MLLTMYGTAEYACNMFTFSFCTRYKQLSPVFVVKVYTKQMLTGQMVKSGRDLGHLQRVQSNKECRAKGAGTYLLITRWEPLVEGVGVGQQVCGCVC